MGDMCMKVIAILFLIAGVAMFANIGVAGWSAIQLSGVMFLLIGLGKLTHMMGMCPMCNVKGSKK